MEESNNLNNQNNPNNPNNQNDPYWIVDDVIIFKPSFNKCLDKYSNIISNYRILIFSNYYDPHQALKNDNRYKYTDEDLYIKSVFNHSLHNTLSNLINLRELTFVNYFNQPLDHILSNLINLRKLTFGNYFNQQLNNSLSKLVNLSELTLGANFNQPVDIPDGIKKLSLNCNSKSIIDYLPSSIEELAFGRFFNLELNDLPSSIKKIIINNPSYNKKLNNLPNQIETLEISYEYKVQIDAKYKNLSIVYF